MELQLHLILELVKISNEFLETGEKHLNYPNLQKYKQLFFYNSADTSSVLADSMDTWYETLQDSGCRKVYALITDPEKQYRFILDFENSHQVWKNELGYKGLSRAMNHYIIEEKATSFVPKNLSFTQARDELAEALKNIAHFAAGERSLSRWEELFSNNLDVMETLIGDDAPPLEKKQQSYHLKQTAYRSWVFGMMASWNDIPFPPSHVSNGLNYTDVSNNLYNAIINALQAAVNM